MRIAGGLLGVSANKINGYEASGVWSLVNAQMETGDSNFPNKPPIPNYIGWYAGDSFSGTTWTDKSGNANHATVTRGTVTTVTTTGNGARNRFLTLQGSTNDGLLFPTTILPSTYTLFHVTRYNGARARIVNGSGNNWLSGHWSGNTGVAYHEGWITSQVDNHQNNWVLSIDQLSFYRSNKVTRTTASGVQSTRLAVNAGIAEYSDWQCAEIIVYNTALSSTDYLIVEEYLVKKYGLV